MSDSMPDCSVALYFDGVRFSYICHSSSQGWRVFPDGSIHPPSKTRVVRIHLHKTLQVDLLKFSGFKIGNKLPDHTGDPWTRDLPSGVIVQTPDGYPPPTGETAGPLTIDFSGASEVLHYCLAVTQGDGSTWDDPKIYDDGSL